MSNDPWTRGPAIGKKTEYEAISFISEGTPLPFSPSLKKKARRIPPAGPEKNRLTSYLFFFLALGTGLDFASSSFLRASRSAERVSTWAFKSSASF